LNEFLGDGLELFELELFELANSFDSGSADDFLYFFIVLFIVLMNLVRWSWTYVWIICTL